MNKLIKNQQPLRFHSSVFIGKKRGILYFWRKSTFSTYGTVENRKIQDALFSLENSLQVFKIKFN